MSHQVMALLAQPGLPAALRLTWAILTIGQIRAETETVLATRAPAPARLLWLTIRLHGGEGWSRPLPDLCVASGLDDRSVRRALKDLVDLGWLEAVEGASRTVFRVCSPGGTANHPRSDTGNTTATEPDDQDGGCQVRERRTPVLLPEDWCPSPRAMQAASQIGRDVDLSTELVRFRFYWGRGKGAGTRRASWDQSWINWVGKAAERQPGRPATAQSDAQRRLEDIKRRFG